MPPLVLAICLDLLLFLRELGVVGVIILQKSVLQPMGTDGKDRGSLKQAREWEA